MGIELIGPSLGGLQAAGAVPTLVRKTVTFTGGAGAGAVGTVNVFTVTGDVAVKLYVKCTTTLVDTVDGATFEVGTATVDNIFWSGSAEPTDLDTIVAGKYLTSNFVNDIGDYTVSGGFRENGDLGTVIDENIIITVETQAINSGVLQFYCLYYPLSSGASVVAA